MAEFKTPPLIEQFKAAGRLANEWRDTLTYGALLTGAVVNAYYGNPISPLNFVALAIAREVGRAASWYCFPDTCLAGNGGEKRRSTMQCVFAAGTLFSGLCVALNLSPALRSPIDGYSVALSLVTCLTDCYIAGGSKEVLATYEYMWDWPRKRGGGGQTERFKEGVRGLTLKLTPARQAPSPV
ncbi:MAG: hypothetical protein WC612_01590 [Bdellovibrionales bacterium]